MVKLRGVNVFPEAVGAVVVEDARSNGEYFCVVDRVGEAGIDEMTVMVETRDASVDTQALKTDLERRMKEVLASRDCSRESAEHWMHPQALRRNRR